MAKTPTTILDLEGIFGIESTQKGITATTKKPTIPTVLAFQREKLFLVNHVSLYLTVPNPS